MKITKYSVTGYKNLTKCQINPNGLHVLTGCNAVGKSNFLETFIFLKTLINGSEEERNSLLEGSALSGGQWIPMLINNIQEPNFIVEGEFEIDDALWEYSYSLSLTMPEMNDSRYSFPQELEISNELFEVKESGKPGKKRIVISRNKDGSTTASAEKNIRRKSKFFVRSNMTAISALFTREPKQFEIEYPVTAKFFNGIGEISMLSLNPKALVECNRFGSSTRNDSHISANKMSIHAINLYENIEAIKQDDFQWKLLCHWANKLLRVSEISLKESINDKGTETEKINRYVLIYQDDKILLPYELSTGTIVILAMLSIVLSPLFRGKIILIEEPEVYVHPKAISDFITLLKELSDERAIIVSTHSPVVLNSLKANQVTLMKFDEQYLAHTFLVSEIKEATDALNRGNISFGDLLQNDFIV